MPTTTDKLERKMEQTVLARMPMPINEYRVWVLLVSAFEGGSNYWYQIDNTRTITPEGLKQDTKSMRRKLGVEYIHQFPLVEGYGLTVREYDDGNDQYSDCKYPLTRERLVEGLKIMAEKYPRHWANFIAENDDAETGDVFLQCCVLGEIVYG